MTVDPCQQRAEQFLAGELGLLDGQAFLAHARTCATCAGVVAQDAELRALRPDGLSVLEGDGLRGSVLRELRAGARLRQGYGGQAPLSWMAVAVRAVAAVLLLAVGVAAGRLWAGSADERPLADHIQQAALDGRTLADVQNSPYTFTNVAFQPLGDDQLVVGFDVSTHVEVTARRSDPLVRQLAVQAMLNPSSLGSRLKAIGYAEGVEDRAVMQALRIAVLNDPDTAVRLRALDALAPYTSDPDVQSTLLSVLGTSGSVPMRLRAIDYLVKSEIDPQKMRVAVASLDPVADAAALVKAAAYIR